MQHAHLSIRLLCEFAVTTGAQPSGSYTARLQALLAYLLLHRDAPQQRQHLAFLFWPDNSEAQALTNLRNLLHKLRQVLPTPEQFLQIEQQTVQWRPDAPYTLDVADFEAAAAQATTCAALEAAVQHYRGELLPSCYDDWILPERERLRQLALTLLDRLITLLETQRDYGRAIRYGRQLLTLEPLNETLYRRLMTLYAAIDDRAGVLHTYQQCVAMLQAEFGAEPATATQELAQRLQRGAPAPPVPTHPAPDVPPLVGRTQEWKACVDAWYRASSGIPHCLLLTGEAGIGKSRLAEELTAWVARQGYGTVVAHCYATEGALAYAPVVTWLRAPFIEATLATLAPIWLTEVARLLPELLSTQPNLPWPGPLTVGWQRQRLFEALARALLNGTGPRLLLLDDLQWCDRDTLEWLHYGLRFAQQGRTLHNPQSGAVCGRVLLVGTVRSEAMRDNQPLRDLLLDWRHADQVTEIAVGPLDAPATAALATAMAGQLLTADQMGDLYQETEGNPLFIVETVRAQCEAHRQGKVRDAWQSGKAGLLQSSAYPSLPPKVHAVIQARLAELASPTRELAGVAATIGRAFSFAVLGHACKQDAETILHGLDELCQRQIVRERSADSYDFTHDKLREAAYNSLSATRRRLLHQAVAGALEVVYAEQQNSGDKQTLDAVSGQIANHYEAAGAYQKAMHYYQQAAEAAHRLSANREAIRLYRRALALVEGPAGHAATPTLTLYVRLGDILHGTSQYEEARMLFAQALNHASALNTVECAALHRQIGNTWREQYDYPNALACYRAALGALEKACPHAPHRTTHERWPIAHPLVVQVEPVAQGTAAWWEEWLQTQLEIDLIHYWLGESEASVHLQDELQPLIEQHGTPGQQATFFQRRSQLALRRHRSVATAAAVQDSRRSLAIYQAAGMEDSLPSAHFMLGFTLLWHDEPAAAAEELTLTLRLAQERGDLSLQARALTYLTIAARRQGQVESTTTLAAQALTVATAAHMPEYVALAQANQAWLAWRQHDLAALHDHSRTALDCWRQLPVTHASAPFQWTALWPLLAAALAKREGETAVAYARQLLDAHQQQLPAPLVTPLHQALTAAARDSAAAFPLLQQAVAQAQQLHYL